MDAYARLVEMCERESELIAAADWDAVVALGNERAVLVGSLPAKPPAGARAHLRRADDLSRAERRVARGCTRRDRRRARTAAHRAGDDPGRTSARRRRCFVDTRR